MSFLTVEMQGMQELQNKLLSTRETHNEEIHRSEINSEITRIEKRNTFDIYCNGCIFTSYKETSSENNNLPSLLFCQVYFLFKIMFANFFKMLIGRSMSVVSSIIVHLVSSIMKCRKTVSDSLFLFHTDVPTLKSRLSNSMKRISAVKVNVLSELLVEWFPVLFALLFRFSAVTSFSHHISIRRTVVKS